jgi:hypothetical protein
MLADTLELIFQSSVAMRGFLRRVDPFQSKPPAHKKAWRDVWNSSETRAFPTT